MSFVIPKGLYDNFGYEKKLAKGKWFDLFGLRVKLSFAGESKYFRSKHQEFQDTVSNPGDMSEDELLKYCCDFYIKSFLIDWNLEEENKGGDKKKVELSTDSLSKLLEQFPVLSEKILMISCDNKQFQKVNVKKS